MDKINKVIFRADGASFLGYGHIYQSLTLAGIFCERGYEVSFAVKDYEPAVIDYVKNKGISVIAIPSAAGEDEDFDILLEYAQRLGAKVVVIDHHLLGCGYALKIREKGIVVVNIDDEGKRKFCGDILINYNIYAPQIKYSAENHTKFLLGPRYAVLRKEFEPPVAMKNKVDKHLLVVLGGGYARGEVVKVLEALKLLDNSLLKEISPQIILGPGYPNPQDIILKHSHYPVTVHFDPKNIRDLMEKSGFAICAGGGTLYEFARMGVLPIIIILDENQILNAESFSKAGIAENLGWYEDVSPGKIAEAIKRQFNSLISPRERADNIMPLVDGLGARRVVDAICRVKQ